MTPAPTSTLETTENPNAKSSSKGYQIDENSFHKLAIGGSLPNQYPKFTDKLKERRFILEHTAATFRIFARNGFNEGVAGHCSIRDPIDPNTFWINPLGLHFALIRAEDLVHVDEDGNILPDGNQEPINAAGFAIHSSLHKARPDVNAACHTHSLYGRAYSAFGKPLEMINQDSCTFFNNQAVYNSFGGVAIEKDEGKAIAEAAGNARAVILQNHGLLTMGKTIDEAAYLFMLMEKTCHAQLLADAAESKDKPKQYIADSEAEYTARITSNPDILYTIFQSDYKLEERLSNGDFKFAD